MSEIRETSEPVNFPAFAPLRFGRVRPAIVVEERIEIVPAAPVEHDHRVDVGAAELRGPGPPEIVHADVLPASVADLGFELLGSRSDPPAKGPLRDVDDRLVVGLVAHVGDRGDRVRERFGDRRLAVLAGLRAVPDPEYHASVSIDDVVRSDADDFLAAKSTADGQPKRDIVGRVEGLVDLIL